MTVYLLGVFPLAIWQDALRASLGDWLSFGVVIGYLLLIRLFSFLVFKGFERLHKQKIAAHNFEVELKKSAKAKFKRGTNAD